ncbi:AAA family ATPase [Cerasicoccus fimbriatus]|uniref:AAA family ATPase n=1 Tax=Cerasicoccus fimbriatus TaxID=3014554 RepID=UPI0022B5CAC1|nr:MoxR family ATPase [Cerasicoccus sp. TK19100]
MDSNIVTKLSRLRQSLESVIVGKPGAMQGVLIALVCDGHLLIEDMPGVGKTILARTLAKSIAGDFKRIQFTPDLLPSDVTGVSVFNRQSNEFEFRAGPVFANVLLADEINRATPRTQSSLLEAMGEKTVTVDGVTRDLPSLFFVIATQNPIELKGTFSLPEAQLDRFFGKLSLGYPSVEEEARVMQMQVRHHPVLDVEPVISVNEVREAQAAVREIHIEPNILDYIARIMAATRDDERLAVGASPRGSLALMRASQAQSLFKGDDYVKPDTVKEVASFVLAHRVILKTRSVVNVESASGVINDILQGVEAPITQ